LKWQSETETNYYCPAVAQHFSIETSKCWLNKKFNPGLSSPVQHPQHQTTCTPALTLEMGCKWDLFRYSCSERVSFLLKTHRWGKQENEATQNHDAAAH